MNLKKLNYTPFETLLRGIKAIQQRLNGEFGRDEIKSFGPLSDVNTDVLHITSEVLTQLEARP